MAVELSEENDGKYLMIRISGKLDKDDYKRFLPDIERLIGRYGKVRILLDMRDFHGWTAGGLWEDVKFDFRHHRDIERLAVIGEKTWQKGMAIVCRPFTSAVIHYYDPEHAEEARNWLVEELVEV